MPNDSFAMICAHVHVSATKQCSDQLTLLHEAQSLLSPVFDSTNGASRLKAEELRRLADLIGSLESSIVNVGESTDALLLENLDLRRQLSNP
ncbi:MAG: hypothetical protein Q7S20_02830 [Gemmatimonadaceae bacterium]|nr:hypothetical protein [Gemmatimonadaceae bacterium]